MLIENNEDSINHEALRMLELHVKEYVKAIKSESITNLLENVENSLKEGIRNFKTKLDDMEEYHIGGCANYFFNDETAFKIILQFILEPQIKDVFPEKNYFYPEISEMGASIFLERIKNLNKHPKLKKIFTDIIKEELNKGEDNG